MNLFFKIKKYNWVFFLFVSFSLFAQTKQPNVLFILADDLGINALNCYGNEKVESPNIDRLFSEGMHFTNGYSNDPTCAPSRSSIMTGQYVPRHGIYRVTDRYKQKKGWLENMQFLPPDNSRPTGKQVAISPEKITIADALKSAGYATAAFGKCHFGSKDLSFGAHGFDEWVETTKHYNFKHYPPQDDILENEYNADYTTRRGIDFMKKKVGEGQPFFLFMPYYLVHSPLEPKTEHLDDFQKKYNRELDEETIKILAMIKCLDESIGQLLATLDELGIDENTIIVFASDNGHYKTTDNIFNQPYRGYKGNTFEGGIRVPYIFKWKNKITEKTSSAEPIIHVDLYPTIMGLVETALPVDYILDGENLSPILLCKKKKTKRDALIWQYTNYAGYNKETGKWRSSWVNVIQSGGFKMTEEVETGKYYLYDLNKDPLEENEVAGNCPKKIEELKNKLEIWKKETGAENPRMNPDYIGGNQ